MSTFSYPWEYQFPPFFTIQPNAETRKTQLEAWRALILDYCQHHKIHQLHLRDWLNKPPFYNESIDRRLTPESMKVVIGSLVERRLAEWIDGKDKETCLIYTRTPEQWAQIIYNYVKKNSLQNSILTFYEMLEDEDKKESEFHQLDEVIFLKALKILEKSGKAAVIEIDGNKGVKFV